MNRGERLQAERRKKEKVRRIIKESWYQPAGASLDRDDKFVGRMAAAPHPCSGMCCGNPRRHYKGRGKLTMQEVREELKQELS